MTMPFRAALITASMLFSTQANAVGVACTGNVTYLATNSDSVVFVDIGFRLIGLCAMNGDIWGVRMDTCKSWYATLMSAKLSNRTVKLTFDTANPQNTSMGTTCDAAGFGPYDWVTRAPYLISIN